mmetsp:Transcript_4577/g.10575  ORF Transcript_4577/g.10575 Transcript_4577/m.10575 type:complete len:119 (-) Transcript_4577:49-405(-)
MWRKRSCTWTIIITTTWQECEQNLISWLVRRSWKAAFLSWLKDPGFVAVLKDADIETANESGIYEVLDADMSNTLSIDEVYVGLMRLRGPIAKSEIVGLILRLRHVTTLIAEMSRKQE